MSAALLEKIEELKKQRRAVILVHNYQVDEVQAAADYLGDSLELSRMASRSEADLIVFCGVHFMAETASILSPAKTVLIPEPDAGCPMADMVDPPSLRLLQAQHPGAVTVAYVNTTAAVKAEADLCCTSANVLKVINSIDRDKEIICVPDKYLAAYAAQKTGRDLIPWEGYCHVHAAIMPEEVAARKAEHPQALTMVHPECSPDVLALADEALSTSGMVRLAQESDRREFIVGTEVGILTRLRKENPGKIFHPVSESTVCPNMKKITLEKVLWALEDLKYEVKVPEDIRRRAKAAVDKMLEIA